MRSAEGPAFPIALQYLILTHILSGMERRQQVYERLRGGETEPRHSSNGLDDISCQRGRNVIEGSEKRELELQQ